MNKKSVFGKTQKGVEEVKNRALDFDKSIRSALIMVDGKTPLGSLMDRFNLVGVQDVPGTIQALEDLGLIELLEAGKGEAITTAHTHIPKKMQDTGELKRTVAKLIEEYFGFMATPHLNRLERCNSRAEILAHVIQCQQLIREAFNTQKADSFKRKADDILF